MNDKIKYILCKLHKVETRSGVEEYYTFAVIGGGDKVLSPYKHYNDFSRTQQYTEAEAIEYMDKLPANQRDDYSMKQVRI